MNRKVIFLPEKKIVCLMIAWCLPLLLVSCGDPVGGTGKSPIFLVAHAPEGDTFSVSSDVYDSSISGYVSNDTADIVIESIYRDQSDNQVDTVLADVILTQYRVTYYRYDGNPDVPEPFDRPVNISVPAGGETSLNFIVVHSDAKLKSPLAELAFGGGEGTIWLTAYVQFYGEDLSGHAVSCDTTISVIASDF